MAFILFYIGFYSSAVHVAVSTLLYCRCCIAVARARSLLVIISFGDPVAALTSLLLLLLLLLLLYRATVSIVNW